MRINRYLLYYIYPDQILWNQHACLHPTDTRCFNCYLASCKIRKRKRKHRQRWNLPRQGLPLDANLSLVFLLVIDHIQHWDFTLSLAAVPETRVLTYQKDSHSVTTEMGRKKEETSRRGCSVLLRFFQVRSLGKQLARKLPSRCSKTPRRSLRTRRRRWRIIAACTAMAATVARAFSSDLSFATLRFVSRPCNYGASYR